MRRVSLSEPSPGCCATRTTTSGWSCTRTCSSPKGSAGSRRRARTDRAVRALLRDPADPLGEEQVLVQLHPDVVVRVAQHPGEGSDKLTRRIGEETAVRGSAGVDELPDTPGLDVADQPTAYERSRRSRGRCHRLGFPLPLDAVRQRREEPLDRIEARQDITRALPATTLVVAGVHEQRPARELQSVLDPGAFLDVRGTGAAFEPAHPRLGQRRPLREKLLAAPALRAPNPKCPRELEVRRGVALRGFDVDGVHSRHFTLNMSLAAPRSSSAHGMSSSSAPSPAFQSLPAMTRRARMFLRACSTSTSTPSSASSDRATVSAVSSRASMRPIVSSPVPVSSPRTCDRWPTTHPHAYCSARHDRRSSGVGRNDRTVVRSNGMYAERPSVEVPIDDATETTRRNVSHSTRRTSSGTARSTFSNSSSTSRASRPSSSAAGTLRGSLTRAASNERSAEDPNELPPVTPSAGSSAIARTTMQCTAPFSNNTHACRNLPALSISCTSSPACRAGAEADPPRRASGVWRSARKSSSSWRSRVWRGSSTPVSDQTMPRISWATHAELRSSSRMSSRSAGNVLWRASDTSRNVRSRGSSGGESELRKPAPISCNQLAKRRHSSVGARSGDSRSISANNVAHSAARNATVWVCASARSPGTTTTRG